MARRVAGNLKGDAKNLPMAMLRLRRVAGKGAAKNLPMAMLRLRRVAGNLKGAAQATLRLRRVAGNLKGAALRLRRVAGNLKGAAENLPYWAWAHKTAWVLHKRQVHLAPHTL